MQDYMYIYLMHRVQYHIISTEPEGEVLINVILHEWVLNK